LLRLLEEPNTSITKISILMPSQSQMNIARTKQPREKAITQFNEV